MSFDRGFELSVLRSVDLLLDGSVEQPELHARRALDGTSRAGHGLAYRLDGGFLEDERSDALRAEDISDLQVPGADEPEQAARSSAATNPSVTCLFIMGIKLTRDRRRGPRTCRSRRPRPNRNRQRRRR